MGLRLASSPATVDRGGTLLRGTGFEATVVASEDEASDMLGNDADDGGDEGELGVVGVGTRGSRRSRRGKRYKIRNRPAMTSAVRIIEASVTDDCMLDK